MTVGNVSIAVHCWKNKQITKKKKKTKTFALATRISQPVASGRLTMLFHATIITQTIALIFSQIDQENSKPPANWSLPFYLSVALEV